MRQILTKRHAYRTFFAHFKIFRTTGRLIKKVQARLFSALACTNIVISDKTERNIKVKNDKTERKNLSVFDKTERNERFR